MSHITSELQDAVEQCMSEKSTALDAAIEELDDRSWAGEDLTIAEGYALERKARIIHPQLVTAGMTPDLWLELQVNPTSEDYVIHDILQDLREEARVRQQAAFNELRELDEELGLEA